MLLRFDAKRNFITLPVENDFNASDLCDLIPGLQMVSRFDSVNQTYKTYICGGPSGFDYPIINGHGYFILVNESSTFQATGYLISSVSIPLNVGWNAIGWYHDYNTTASSLGENISGCEIVSKFDCVNQIFQSYICGGPPGFDFVITQGMGLFVLVDETSTWLGEG